MSLTPINHVALAIAGWSLASEVRDPKSKTLAASEQTAAHFCAPGQWVWLAAMLVLGVSCGVAIAAQEADSTPQTNEVAQIISDVLQTNDVIQAEDMVLADDNGQSDEAASSAENARGNTDGTNSAGPSERKHSGRESRSRRFSSPPNRFGGSSDTASRSSGQAGTNASPTSLEYSAFKLVAERNIFNPNRYPHRSNYRPPTKDADYFALVGIMSYEKGTFAFFSGSSSAYQKVLRTAETIAGYKLTAINSNSVKLVLETNEVDLSVGMQMRRDDDNTWQLVKAPTVYAASSSAGASGPNPSPSSSASVQPGTASTGAESDVLKRMMQRREQE